MKNAILLLGFVLVAIVSLFIPLCLRLRRKWRLQLECWELVNYLETLPSTYELVIEELRRRVDRLCALDEEYTLNSFIPKARLEELRRKAARDAALELDEKILEAEIPGKSVSRTVISMWKLARDKHLGVAGIALDELYPPSDTAA